MTCRGKVIIVLIAAPASVHIPAPAQMMSNLEWPEEVELSGLKAPKIEYK